MTSPTACPVSSRTSAWRCLRTDTPSALRTGSNPSGSPSCCESTGSEPRTASKTTEPELQRRDSLDWRDRGYRLTCPPKSILHTNHRSKMNALKKSRSANPTSSTETRTAAAAKISAATADFLEELVSVVYFRPARAARTPIRIECIPNRLP